MITPDQIRRFAPHAMPTVVQAFVGHADAIAAAGITTPLRVCHFMAETAVESQGLSRLEENLNYRPERLVEVFPRFFPTLAAASPYSFNPQDLANKVYGGRLGNTQPNDGWTYRGSGLLDTTGRFNFRLAGHENDPDTLRQPVGALLAALKYWTDHGLNRIADANDIVELRKRVQGGTLGLNDARAYFASAQRIFV